METGVIHKGWLERKSAYSLLGESWKKRYFTLVKASDGYYFRYYPEDSCINMRGEARIGGAAIFTELNTDSEAKERGIKKRGPNDFIFEFKPMLGECATWILKAPSEGDGLDW